MAIRQRVTDFVITHPVITTNSWDSLKAEVAAVTNERWYPWSRVLWVPHINPADKGAVAYVNKLRSEWEYDPTTVMMCRFKNGAVGKTARELVPDRAPLFAAPAAPIPTPRSAAASSEGGSRKR